MTSKTDAAATLKAAAAKRILVLDGAMGTMIQDLRLDEAGYRGDRFKDWHQDVKGNNDLLNLTQGPAIRDIHVAYLEAGADIVETNTFSSTTIAQADYAMEEIAYELNLEGARLAREACDIVSAREPDRPRFVAGALGPTNRTLSISPDVNNPGYRAVSFDELKTAYAEAVRGLIDGGADLLLVETIFDTLNAKAALFAIDEVLEEKGVQLPVMISGTITDLSDRMAAEAELRAAAAAAGATIDENGNWVAADGTVIDKDDLVISDDGTVTTKSGRLLAKEGMTINENGEFVDANGNVVKAENVVVQTADGRFVDANGNEIPADELIVGADGTVRTKAQVLAEAGLTVNENGDYVDKDGNTVPSEYINWAAGEPNGGTAENCVVYVDNEASDVDCSVQIDPSNALCFIRPTA